MERNKIYLAYDSLEDTELWKIKERYILVSIQNKKLEMLVEQRTNELKIEMIIRKRLEEELRKVEDILKSYIEKTPIEINVMDTQFKFLDAK